VSIRKCVLLCAMTVTLVLASGCALMSSPSAVADKAEITKPIPAPVADFTSTGRFSAKRAQSQASGQFRYAQKGADRTLEIFSPTSTPIARIEANAQSATLTLSDGAVRSATTLSELLQSFIDIRVTDTQFSAWLQGLPTSMASASAIERDEQLRVQRFTEAAWMIEIGARMDGDAGFVRRMRWTYAPEADTEVRWVIDEFATQ
jgi:outer membrane biogenesis lipoprotein LolB